MATTNIKITSATGAQSFLIEWEWVSAVNYTVTPPSITKENTSKTTCSGQLGLSAVIAAAAPDVITLLGLS